MSFSPLSMVISTRAESTLRRARTRCRFTACALILGWFRGFPAWCAAVFCIFLALGFAAMWLGLIFKARRETQVLNQGLKNYTKS